MSRWEAWLQHLSNLMVGGTGLVFAWMLYFATPEDEFSIWNHPLQGQFRDLHLLAAPILILSFGMVWSSHASKRLRATGMPGYRTGILLLLSFLPMAVSAYCLQVAVEEHWRTVWRVVHVATSLLWILAYLAHQWGRRGRPQSAN